MRGWWRGFSEARPRSLRQDHLRQARPAVLTVVVAVAAATLLVGGLFVFADVRTTTLLDDPSAVLEGPAFAGALSVVGAACWIVAGTAALLAAAETHRRRDRELRLLRIVGVASALLWVDDQYMLHDSLVPRLAGGSELWLTVPIALAALVVAAKVWRTVLDHPDGVLLLLAVAFLGSSLLLDLSGSEISGRHAVEDLAKLAGLGFWAQFGVRAARRRLRNALEDMAAPASEEATAEAVTAASA